MNRCGIKENKTATGARRRKEVKTRSEILEDDKNENKRYEVKKERSCDEDHLVSGFVPLISADALFPLSIRLTRLLLSPHHLYLFWTPIYTIVCKSFAPQRIVS